MECMFPMQPEPVAAVPLTGENPHKSLFIVRLPRAFRRPMRRIARVRTVPRNFLEICMFCRNVIVEDGKGLDGTDVLRDGRARGGPDEKRVGQRIKGVKKDV